MFKEKERLLHNERSPLIANPIIWTRSHEFRMDSMDPYRIGREQKKQRFQWLVFFGVTMFSLFLLFLLIASMVRLTEHEMAIPHGPRIPSKIRRSSSTMAPSTVEEILLNMTSVDEITSTTTTGTTLSPGTLSESETKPVTVTNVE